MLGNPHVGNERVDVRYYWVLRGVERFSTSKSRRTRESILMLSIVYPILTHLKNQLYGDNRTNERFMSKILVATTSLISLLEKFFANVTIVARLKILDLRLSLLAK